MRIVNQTQYSTQDIAKLVRRVAADELQPGQLKRAVIKVRYQRKNGLKLGHCMYGNVLRPNVRMLLLVPRDTLDVVKLAKVIAHELGHAKGLRHVDMKNTRYGWLDGWRDRYAYAKDYQIGVKVTRKPTMADKACTKLAHAERMLSLAETRAKRAGTICKKWRRRVNTYSKVLSKSVLDTDTNKSDADKR